MVLLLVKLYLELHLRQYRHTCLKQAQREGHKLFVSRRFLINTSHFIPETLLFRWEIWPFKTRLRVIEVVLLDKNSCTLELNLRQNRQICLKQA